MTTTEEIDLAIGSIYNAIKIDKADPKIVSAALSLAKLFVILVKDINRIADAVEKIERQ